MNTPSVTVVMTPRDRFSYTQVSVEALYQLSDIPFQFIFVDGGFPASVRRYLSEQSKKNNFLYIREDRYLAPNHAKNLALPHITGKYIVFMDNDCIPMNRGWLGALVRCAEETGAAMVSPLVCEGWPEPDLVHFAGGKNRVEEVEDNGKKKRIIQMSIDGQGEKVSDALNRLTRRETELTEMHAMLVRADWLQKIGRFDSEVLGSRDHVDFCLEVTTRDGKIYLEPSARVRFLPEPPLGPALKMMDMEYYCLRWSDDWIGDCDATWRCPRSAGAHSLLRWSPRFYPLHTPQV